MIRVDIVSLVGEDNMNMRTVLLAIIWLILSASSSHAEGNPQMCACKLKFSVKQLFCQGEIRAIRILPQFDFIRDLQRSVIMFNIDFSQQPVSIEPKGCTLLEVKQPIKIRPTSNVNGDILLQLPGNNSEMCTDRCVRKINNLASMGVVLKECDNEDNEDNGEHQATLCLTISPVAFLVECSSSCNSSNNMEINPNNKDMNGGKSFDASSQDNQGLILAVSFAAIFGTVIIFGVAIAIGLWFYKSRTSKRRPQENLAQQDRPSPQGNAVVYEELPYDTHVTDYSIPMDCIAPPPPVGSRPVREEKQQNGRDCYQCAINNQSTTVKSGEIVYSKYPPTALQPPVVSNAYSTQPVLDSANSSSTPQPVKSHTEDQNGDVSKEEERKEALYFTLEKGGSETSSDEEDYFHRKTSNFGLLPVENEDEGDQPDIN